MDTVVTNMDKVKIHTSGDSLSKSLNEDYYHLEKLGWYTSPMNPPKYYICEVNLQNLLISGTMKSTIMNAYNGT